MAVTPGSRFGRLMVLEEIDRNQRGERVWLCRCDCGEISNVIGTNLNAGRTTSCGCRKREISAPTHGMSGTPEYMAWGNMIQRCSNPKFIHYHRYGGRGISVCEKWRNSFESFLADMGPRPSEHHSVERRDGDGNYEPGNCVWATMDVQSNNTARNVFYELDGERLSESQLARKFNLKVATLRARLKTGMSLEEALDAKRKGAKRYNYAGLDLTLREWSELTGIVEATIRDRIDRQGMTIFEALTSEVRGRLKTSMGEFQ